MDKVVCVSEAQAQAVRRAGVRDDRLTVIHNAIRFERFANPDPAYRDLLCRMFPEPPALIVDAAGRLSPEKGFDILIDAAAEVLRSPFYRQGTWTTLSAPTWGQGQFFPLRAQCGAWSRESGRGQGRPHRFHSLRRRPLAQRPC